MLVDVDIASYTQRIAFEMVTQMSIKGEGRRNIIAVELTKYTSILIQSTSSHTFPTTFFILFIGFLTYYNIHLLKRRYIHKALNGKQ